MFPFVSNFHLRAPFTNLCHSVKVGATLKWDSWKRKLLAPSRYCLVGRCSCTDKVIWMTPLQQGNWSVSNVLLEFSASPLKPNSLTLPGAHCIRWLVFIPSRHPLLTSWTNEGGPCNLVNEALRWRWLPHGVRPPHYSQPAFLCCIVTLSAEYPLSCHGNAAELHQWRGCCVCTGSLPSLRSRRFLFWAGRGRTSASFR